MVLHAVRWAPLLIRAWCVGLDFVEKQRRQVRQGVGEKLAFAQQLSGTVHVGTCAGGNKNVNLRISQEKEIMTRCFPSLILFVTPVLPGLGSDIRMKIRWKVQSKTRKSGVWFFQNAGVGGRGGYCRCLWVRLIGYGRDRTTLRGRFPVVPHAA